MRIRTGKLRALFLFALFLAPALGCGTSDAPDLDPGDEVTVVDTDQVIEAQEITPLPEDLAPVEEEEIEEVIENPVVTDEEIFEVEELRGRGTGKGKYRRRSVKAGGQQSKPVNEVIGVGGGSGGHAGGKVFKGSYKKTARVRGRKAGARAVPVQPPLSHGGSAPTNGKAFDLQFFENYGVNPMIDTDDDALSTFAADTDTGSYTICRNFLKRGVLPEPDAVRVEEFVNYFDYGYRPPEKGLFTAYIEGGPSPFAPNRKLLMLGLKGMEIDASDRKDAVLTFVIDVSGSMNRDNRLGLVKQALGLLVDRLRPSDAVGIVVYGSEGRDLLETRRLAGGRREILDAIDGMRADGSTNAEEGLLLGYAMAERHFRKECINRVILCSDGVANVGNTGPDTILSRIEDRVKKGIYLTTVGFGMDNYNDVLMERLGDRGNGRYAYVDRIEEARRVFVEDLTGNLQVIARDLKIQVEFNPKKVRSYRLVGYENRRVKDKDFRNPKVDGGEVGAGHSVTALYELKLWDRPAETGPMGWFRVVYKDRDYSEDLREYEAEIRDDHIKGEGAAGSEHFRLASVVGQFAEVLRKSYWARDLDAGSVTDSMKKLCAGLPPDKRNAELSMLGEYMDRILGAKKNEDPRKADLESVAATGDGD